MASEAVATRVVQVVAADAAGIGTGVAVRMRAAAAVAAAADLLAAGGLVAFPTETVYGLGALPSRPATLARLFAVKGRPADNPLIMHVADTAAARRLTAGWHPLADRLAAHFWPGPLTMILPAAPGIPAAVTAGLSTVGVRVPAHPIALALLQALGEPLAAPSANRSGRPSPTTAAHVLADLAGLVDLIIDGGPTPVGVESTVLDLSTPAPVLLRPGAVTLEQLCQFIPGLSAAATPSPAVGYRHYRPAASLVLVLGEDTVVVHNMLKELAAAARADGKRPGLLLAAEFGDDWPEPRVVWGSLANPDTLAAGLYVGLRQLDEAGVDLILTHGVEPIGIGLAVQNRLLQAAERVYRPRFSKRNDGAGSAAARVPHRRKGGSMG